MVVVVLVEVAMVTRDCDDGDAHDGHVDSDRGDDGKMVKVTALAIMMMIIGLLQQLVTWTKINHVTKKSSLMSFWVP